MAKTMSPAQDAAIKAFEKAHEEWKHGAMGRGRRYRQHADLAAAHKRVADHGVEDALTDTEKLDAVTAASYL